MRSPNSAEVSASTLLVALALAWRWADYPMPAAVKRAFAGSQPGIIIVSPGESISDAIARATPGTMILVEPGEYRERLTLAGDVRLVSMVPRGAVLRLPSTATDQDALVTAVDVASAELAGFRIVGDAASPLGTGVLTRSSNVRLIDLEITGAARTAVDLGPGAAPCKAILANLTTHLAEGLMNTRAAPFSPVLAVLLLASGCALPTLPGVEGPPAPAPLRALQAR